MSGYHGTVGAIGVRPSVCPEPLRRVLLLAGLVLGIMLAVWLWSAPAHAQEAAHTGSAPFAANPIVGETGNVGTPVGDTLTTVEERVTRVTDGTTEMVPAVESEPVQHVHEAVLDTSLTQKSSHPVGLTEALAPVTAQVADPVLDPRDEHARDDGTGEVEEITETVQADEPTATVASERRPEWVVPDGTQVPHTVTEIIDDQGGLDQDTLDRTSVSGGTLTAPANSSGAGGTSSAPAVAGFLPGPTDPAPAPGLFEAARHVLLSVPADSADEPIFSPD